MTNIWGFDIDIDQLKRDLIQADNVLISDMKPGDIIFASNGLGYEVIRPYKRTVKVRQLFVRTNPRLPFSERTEKIGDYWEYWRMTRKEAAAIIIHQIQFLKEHNRYTRVNL